VVDRLSGVLAFVTAVDAGGFAAAGERLNLTRSAVGKSIARLEARLNVRLCHRTTRSLSLTDDGQAFYERCVRALAELEAAHDAFDAGRTEPAGKLRISLPVLFGRRCVAPILMDLARAHPKLELALNFSDRPVDLVGEGYDLSVRNDTLPDSTELVARRLGGQRMTVCAAPGYLAQQAPPQALAELERHEAVVYATNGRLRSWLFPDGSGAMRELRPRSRVQLDDLEAIADAATAGMGLAWLPCWLVAERVKRGELQHVLAHVPAMTFDTHALWPKAPQVPLRVRVVIDALAARLPALMGP
jgi:DNA-binding transcriptional LysR family regulator